jgi:hypothetical protein
MRRGKRARELAAGLMAEEDGANLQGGCERVQFVSAWSVPDDQQLQIRYVRRGLNQAIDLLDLYQAADADGSWPAALHIIRRRPSPEDFIVDARRKPPTQFVIRGIRRE